LTAEAPTALSGLFLALLDADKRREAAASLARALGVDLALLFLRDPELGIPLPAPGFVQSLPDADSWRQAASRAAEEGLVRDLRLQRPQGDTSSPAMAVGIPDGTALILLGGNPDPGLVSESVEWLPWVSRVLTAENGLRLAKAQERMAQSAVSTANRMSTALEGMRRSLESALRKAELEHDKAMREEEERRKFVALVENSVECISMADPDGRVFYINPAGCRMLGLSCPDESREMTIPDFLSEDFRPAFRDLVLPALMATGHWEGEVRFRNARTGEEPHVLQTLFLVRDPGKAAPLCIANVALDMTERKRAEEVLKHTEAQLLQSQKMESVGKLAGGIAHDFNNLLTAILGFAELSLPQVEPGSTLYGNLEEIRKAGERAAGLTRQLLAYSRKQILSAKVLDLNAAVAHAYGMLSRLIGEDVHLRVLPGPGLGMVKADPNQLDQVLLNLVINARDAMPQGGTVTIATSNAELDEKAVLMHPEMTPGRYVLLTVSDTGTGIAPDVMARIFEPFFTTKEFGKGSGMGLPMVQGIVKQSGGYILVETAAGKGSVFKIYLPRVEPEQATADTAPIGRQTAFGGSETILLVEDEESVRRLARGILEMQGYRVLEGRDGQDGETVGRRFDGNIDLLLTDVIMPKSNGKALADSLTALRPGMRVVFMSGYTDEAILRHGFIEANNNFIQKPFTPERLVRTVREALDARTEKNLA
jgi:two-component system, cell cycle sensor histidine kinase and response regulator CckA